MPKHRSTADDYSARPRGADYENSIYGTIPEERGSLREIPESNNTCPTIAQERLTEPDFPARMTPLRSGIVTLGPGAMGGETGITAWPISGKGAQSLPAK